MASKLYSEDMAKGLFDAAKKDGYTVKWLGELRLLADLLQEKALSDKIRDKAVSMDDKVALIADRGGKLSPELENLLFMLVEKQKVDLVGSISMEYQRLVDEQYGIEGTQRASVTTAIPLEETAALDLGKRLTQITGKPVVIESKVDPEILGGMIIRIGDKLIDGSVRSKLQTISKELV
ncbi:MAG: ATP synthase F1 subunit delta [Dehalococcoidales bacterium]|jgi:F-type H+-transporting ATPase subunit delta|nr:ATP synthase F1 subunit delta [Dehalococcoidales bacterium]